MSLDQKIRDLQRSIENNFQRLHGPSDYDLFKHAHDAHPTDPDAAMEEYNRLVDAKRHPWRTRLSRWVHR
jgi:uncharacterized short protein YbdD (DUF466 family)